jgi:hypothetical protein
MTARSLGALALLITILAPTPRARGEAFRIVAIPDTQEYARWNNQLLTGGDFDGRGIFNRHVQWIADQRTASNTAFVTHLGDVWHNYGNQPVEHTIANGAMSRLDGVLPYSVAIGNHDYDQVGTVNGFSGQISGTSTFENYFGPDTARFSGKPWYGGSFRGVNSYQTFSAGGFDLLHLTLEVEPDDNVLNWAQGVIDAHPGRPTFFTIHEWLFPYDEEGSDQAAWQEIRYRKAFPANDAETVFNQLMKENPQVFMVLAGHAFRGEHGENSRVDLNDAGLPVYSMLSDYQGRDNGGDGWLRLLDFDTDLNELSVQTYSTELGRFETDADSQFTLPLDLARYAVIPEPGGLVLALAAGALLLRRRMAR